MSKIAVRVENLSKAYRVGQPERRADTLLGWCTSVLSAPVRNYRAIRSLTKFKEIESAQTIGQTARESEAVDSSRDIHWALRNISFEIEDGTAVGIIGRNGAGKSTLLKILSRITRPSGGRAEIFGRAGSLLEVGTGFHPDLTGRENIYLNAAILGMKRAEIDASYSDIVAFSGVERFIDTPVKRYSSGMKVRLAFAVAAHLRPEVLILDEVLAVGDAEFQERCLGKMNAVARQGRTVLFVSHNMAAVETLTTRCLLLEDGELRADGASKEVVGAYLSQRVVSRSISTRDLPRTQGHHGLAARICTICPCPSNGSSFLFGEDLVFLVELELNSQVGDLRLGITVETTNSTPVLAGFSPERIPSSRNGPCKLRLRIGSPAIAPGDYTAAMSIGIGGLHRGRRELDVVRPGVAFRVEERSMTGSAILSWSQSFGSVIALNVDLDLV